MRASLALHPGALLLVTDALTLQHAAQIVDFVSRNRVPSMLDHPELVVTGALMGYGPSTVDLWRRAASYVDWVGISFALGLAWPLAVPW